MLTSSPQLQNLDDLREYVERVLCEKNQLMMGYFPVTERTLVKSGKPCGVYFCLHGPRAVKFSAIWETERNTILFYGPTGERNHRVSLMESPTLEPAAA